MISVLMAAAVLTVRGDRLYIPARINGVAVEAVLDSAAEATIVDDGFATRIGLSRGRSVTAKGSGGQTDAQLVEHARVEAIGLKLPDVTIAVIDLDDIGERLFGRKVDAIVGRELFDVSRLSIDIDRHSISPVARGTVPMGARLPLKRRRGIETIPVSINGGKAVWGVFDLGNGSDLLIGKAYARRAGLLKHVEGRERGGGIGGAVERQVVTLKSVRLAGVTFRNVRAAIDEQPNAADANVGVKLLRRFRIVTDFAQRSIWLQPRRSN